jgi:hypothetical protein
MAWRRSNWVLYATGHAFGASALGLGIETVLRESSVK